MILTLASDLTYIDARILNPERAYLPNEPRIGRRATDILPSDIIETALSVIHRARQSRGMEIFEVRTPDGVLRRSSVLTPDPDLIIVSSMALTERSDLTGDLKNEGLSVIR